MGEHLGHDHVDTQVGDLNERETKDRTLSWKKGPQNLSLVIIEPWCCVLGPTKERRMWLVEK